MFSVTARGLVGSSRLVGTKAAALCAVAGVLSGVLVLGSAATAQPPAGMGGAGGSQPVEAPKAVTPVALPAPAVTSTDADVNKAVKLVSGSFASKAVGTLPALVFRSAVVNVKDLDNAVYFEIAREDSGWAPFRQGIITFYKDAKGTLFMRVLDPARVNAGFGNAVAGLFAAPEAFPLMGLDKFVVNTQIALKPTADGAGFEGSASGLATLVGGAVSFDSEVKIGGVGGGGITWTDRGFDAKGAQVWGPGKGESVVFAAKATEVKADRRDSGLIVIDMNAADGEVASTGKQVAVQYSGWLLDGYQFDSSRRDGREPLVTGIPPTLIQGWNEGLPGIRKGQFRRLIIPAALGYGESGRPRANIPGGATLVFEIEAVFVGEPAVQPAPMPTPAAGGAQPAPQPAQPKNP